MMSVLVALLSFGTPLASAPPAPVAEEIVVSGERLRNWRGAVRTNAAGTRCRTKRSTGDAELDAVGCAAMVACMPRAQPIFVAAAQAKRGERRRLEAAASRELTVCVGAEHDRLLADLAERRYQRRIAAHAQD